MPLIKFRRRIFETGNSYRIVIPMEIIKALSIKKGDDFEIWLDDSQIIMRKVK